MVLRVGRRAARDRDHQCCLLPWATVRSSETGRNGSLERIAVHKVAVGKSGSTVGTGLAARV
jgi:hypothetical protein